MSTPTAPGTAPAQHAEGGVLRRLWDRTEPLSAALVIGLCLLTIWPARQLFEDGGWWGQAVALTVGLVALAAVVRLLTGSTVLATVAQVVAAVVLLLRGFLADTLAAGLLPTPRTVSAVVEKFRTTGQLLAESSAPVPVHEALTFALLCVIALLVVFTDSAVHTLRSVLMGAVAPLLVFVTLAANRTTHEPWWWFLLIAATWAGLLALHHSAETAPASGRGRGILGAPGRGAMLSTAAALTTIGVVVALVVPAVLPEREQRLVGRGLAEDSSLATVDFTDTLDLESDLRSDDERPVILWHSESSSPGPLRITATDRFADDRWSPQEGRAAAEVLSDPRAVEDVVPDRLPRVDWAGELEATEEAFAVTANGIPAPFLATPSFPVDLRSPVAVTGDPVTDAVWIGEDARRYEGTALEPTVPEELPQSSGGASAPDAALAVPEQIAGTIAETNAQVVDPDDAPLDKARAIQSFLRNGDFEYSLDAAEPQDGESMVQAFLREKRGYCTQYATTMIMMAREQGIPARMAIGMLPGDQTSSDVGRGSDVGPERLVQRNDAHAWPELYFEGVGWLRFEPTPSERAAAAPAYSQPVGAEPSASPSPSEASPSPSEASPSPSEASPSPSEASPSPSSSQAEDDQDGAESSGWWRTLLAVLAVLLLAALALAYLPWRARQARSRVTEGEQSPWSAAWETLRLDLLDRGVSTRSTDSVRAQAKAVLGQRPAVDADALAELAERAEAARYGRPASDGSTETATGAATDASGAATGTAADAGPDGAADELRRRVLVSVDDDESFIDRTRRQLFPASASR
ncbi:transglutaminaseTgpA domain-containing protein [Kytococcus sedentarius]|uniref:transglutaminase family protein n=1 Tax=Kytococcus sedentarius TaxID=1276 RepID=UPI0035BC641E